MAWSLTVGTLTNSESFIVGDLNWKFCSQFPTGTQKPDIQIKTFLTLDLLIFLGFYFLAKKYINLLDTQEHCIRKLGKI